MTRVQFLLGTRDFVVMKNIQTGCGAHHHNHDHHHAAETFLRS
jgi:hypothetical protein